MATKDEQFEIDENDEEEELPILTKVPDPLKKVPVTILTGFLGSGKTTLLNYILSVNHGKRIAVIENEFSGGLGIEGMIAKNGLNGENLEGFFELNNGCICCTVKEDLLSTLEQLVLHKDRFDYILIETTGVANPGPVITAFWSDDAIESSLKLDGVVCVVDSLNIQEYFVTSDISNDVRMQISYADRILLNKSDLVTIDKMELIEKEIKTINNLASILKTSYADISTDWILDINCYTTNILDNNLENDIKKGLITGKMCIPCDPCVDNNKIKKSKYLTDDEHALCITNNNDSNIKNISRIDKNINLNSNPKNNHSAASLSTCSISFPGFIDIKRLNSFLDDILFGNGSKVGGGYRQADISYINLLDKNDKNSDNKKNGIDDDEDDGNNLDENIRSNFNDIVVFTSAPKISNPQKIDGKKIDTNDEINKNDINDKNVKNSSSHSKIDSNDMKIFRIKGVLHVHDEKYLQVLQAVFDIFEIKSSSFLINSENDLSIGLNRIVVIGRNINNDEIEEGFLSCIL